ncbi:MAG: polysaccharide pyruvyl transferase family protein [Acetobacteraceae bacterium]
MRTVHLACLCDVANFGDALFPLLAERRLHPFGYRVTGITLSGRASAWPDAPVSISLRDLVGHAPASAGVLIGGGNIIVARPTSLAEAALASLWLGASWHAAVHDLKLLWNAPGLPRPFTRHPLGLLARAALDAADRVAVRDAYSHSIIEDLRPDTDLVPDTAIDLASLWPAAMLAPVFRDLLARTAAPTDRPIVVVHVRARDGDAGFPQIAAAIDAFAREHDCLPLLLALGPAVHDDIVLRRLSSHLSAAHILLDAPRTLQEIAAALAFARGYVGQSLHGYVAAAAYAVPGILVAPPPARRFRGFLDHCGRPDALVADWSAAFARLVSLPPRRPLPDAMHAALDGHWQATAAILDGPRAINPGALALLRLAAKLGAEHLGPDWALRSLMPGTYSTRHAQGRDGMAKEAAR